VAGVTVEAMTPTPKAVPPGIPKMLGMVGCDYKQMIIYA